jgi:hypothetical protein
MNRTSAEGRLSPPPLRRFHTIPAQAGHTREFPRLSFQGFN